MSRCRPGSSRRAFTLIELLVVIAIIAVLIALLVPAVQKVREAAARTQCGNTLKQLGIAVQSYHDAKKELPPGRLNYDGGATWCILIMPYIDQGNASDQWDIVKSYYEQPAALRGFALPIFFCPARRSPSTTQLSTIDIPEAPWSSWPWSPDPAITCVTSAPGFPGSLGDYATCDGDNINGLYNTPSANGPIILGYYTLQPGGPPYRIRSYRSYTKIATILDGTSNTILIGEKHVPLNKFGTSGDGSIYNGDPGNRNMSRSGGPSYPIAAGPTSGYIGQFGSYHPGICQFVFCDGSVRAFPVSINATMLGYFAARDDGNPVSFDF